MLVLLLLLEVRLLVVVVRRLVLVVVLAPLVVMMVVLLLLLAEVLRRHSLLQRCPGLGGRASVAGTIILETQAVATGQHVRERARAPEGGLERKREKNTSP